MTTDSDLTVRTYGEAGPPVFVLHGGPGAAGHMAPVARELAGAGFRVFEPFQRRSGPEPLTVAAHIEDTRRVIEHQALGEPPFVVGASWGAMLALATAAEHPDLFRAIVLAGSGTYDEAARARFHELVEERTPPAILFMLAAAEHAPDPDAALAEAAKGLTSAYSCELVTTELEDEWVDARANRETMADWHRRREQGDYPASFASITCPVLMLHGDTDPHPGTMIRDSLLPVLPHLEYVEFERCGHFLWFERHASAPFFATMIDWLRQRS